MKKAEFLGNSLKAIKGFPDAAKQRIGNEIHRLQRGASPTDFKPIKAVGAGVFEIRVSEGQSWFRAFYATKFKGKIYIIHAFEKKRNQTDPKDIRAARKIYSSLVKDEQEGAK
jgi:phage-related protein